MQKNKTITNPASKEGLARSEKLFVVFETLFHSTSTQRASRQATSGRRRQKTVAKSNAKKEGKSFISIFPVLMKLPNPSHRKKKLQTPSKWIEWTAPEWHVVELFPYVVTMKRKKKQGGKRIPTFIKRSCLKLLWYGFKRTFPQQSFLSITKHRIEIRNGRMMDHEVGSSIIRFGSF